MKKYTIIIFVLLSSVVKAENIVYETEWISSKESSKKLKEMNGNRLFPCNIEGKVQDIRILYKSSYCPLGKDMDYFYSRWGMSEHWYQSYTEDYTRMGYNEYFHSTFVDLGGNTIHQATWMLTYDSAPTNNDGPLGFLLDLLSEINTSLSN